MRHTRRDRELRRRRPGRHGCDAVDPRLPAPPSRPTTRPPRPRPGDRDRARRAGCGRSRPGRSRSAFALLALGFLIAAQLAAEGPRVRYTTQERTPLVETALALQRQQDELKDRIVAAPRRTIAGRSRSRAGHARTLVRTLNDRLEEARIAAGLIPLTGTGLVLQLEDSTQPVPAGAQRGRLPRHGAATSGRSSTELWLAGAEAIAVNGERVTTSRPAILDIGGSILVNSAYLAAAVPGHGDRPRTCSPALDQPELQEFVRTRRGSFGIGISRAEHVRPSTCGLRRAGRRSTSPARSPAA